MKLEKVEVPDWWKKLDAHSRMQLRFWQREQERPPQILNGFVNFDADSSDYRQKIESLGVQLHSVGGGINTATIPWHVLQEVCELDFVKSVSFAKPLHMVHSPLPIPDMKKLPEDRKGREKWFQDRH